MGNGRPLRIGMRWLVAGGNGSSEMLGRAEPSDPLSASACLSAASLRYQSLRYQSLRYTPTTTRPPCIHKRVKHCKTAHTTIAYHQYAICDALIKYRLLPTSCRAPLQTSALYAWTTRSTRDYGTRQIQQSLVASPMAAPNSMSQGIAAKKSAKLPCAKSWKLSEGSTRSLKVSLRAWRRQRAIWM